MKSIDGDRQDVKDTAATEFVAGAFSEWRESGKSPFAYLADDVRWTIHGSSQIAGSYVSKDDFVRAKSRISHRITSGGVSPTVLSIATSGEWVSVLWRGAATAIDGRPYDNTYFWRVRVVGSLIVEGEAMYDDAVVDDLLSRLPDRVEA